MDYETEDRSPIRSPRKASGQRGNSADPSHTRSQARPGRRPAAFYRLAVGAAVLHLGDRAFLEVSPLAQLPAVMVLAEEEHPREIWRRGLTLRGLLNQAIQDTIEAADGDDMESFRLVLLRAADGETLTAIAADLGIRRESLSRGLWSVITDFVWERLKARLAALHR